MNIFTILFIISDFRFVVSNSYKGVCNFNRFWRLYRSKLKSFSNLVKKSFIPTISTFFNFFYVIILCAVIGNGAFTQSHYVVEIIQLHIRVGSLLPF